MNNKLYCFVRDNSLNDYMIPLSLRKLFLKHMNSKESDCDEDEFLNIFPQFLVNCHEDFCFELPEEIIE